MNEGNHPGNHVLFEFELLIYVIFLQTQDELFINALNISTPSYRYYPSTVTLLDLFHHSTKLHLNSQIKTCTWLELIHLSECKFAV